MDPNAIADALQAEKDAHESLNEVTKRLYELRCFETITHPNGAPIAMRVPGGWIFYMAGGRGNLKLIVGEDDDNAQIVGEQGSVVSQVFVPYSEEFINGCDGVRMMQ